MSKLNEDELKRGQSSFCSLVVAGVLLGLFLLWRAL